MQLTLKVACGIFFRTGEGNLGHFLLQQISNFPVCDFADLVVLLHNLAILIAYATFAFRHQCVACLVRLANVAVNATPTIIALTVLLGSYGSVLSIGKRPTDYDVVSTYMLHWLVVLFTRF